MASGELIVKVGVNNAGVKWGLEQAQGYVRKFRSSLNKLGGGVIGFAGLTMGIKSVIDRAAEMSKLSNQFAVPVESLQRLENAGKACGVSTETMVKGLKKMQAAGLGMDGFYQLADQVAAAKTENEAFTIAAAALGENLASDLYPVLRQGGDEMRRLGESTAIMSENMVASLAKAHQEIEQVKNIFTIAFGYIAQALSYLAPVMQTIGAVIGACLSSIGNGWGEVIDIIQHALSGDLTGAFQRFTKLHTNMLAHAMNAWQGFKEGVKDIWSDFNQPPPQPPARPQGAPIEDSKDIKERERLEKSIAEEKRRRQLEELNTLGKIHELQKEYNDLLKEAEGLTGNARLEKQLEAEKRLTELNKEKKNYGKQRNDLVKERGDRIDYTEKFEQATQLKSLRSQGRDFEADKLEREFEKQDLIRGLMEKGGNEKGEKLTRSEAGALAEKQLAANDEKNVREAKIKYEENLEKSDFSRMTDSDKAVTLYNKKNRLEDEAADAETKGDKAGAWEKRSEALSVADDLESLLKSVKDKTKDDPAAVVDSKQAIGAGGGISATVDRAQSEREKHTRLLEEIARALEEERPARSEGARFAA